MAKRRYDLEAFIVAMHDCRRWSIAKSTTTWDEYKSNAKFMAVEDNHDYGGPADAPLRISFPGWLTCSDYDDDVSAWYQDRSMLTSSKAESLSDEHRAQMLAETNIGFDTCLRLPAASKHSMPTNSSSATHYGGRASCSAKSLLKDAMSPNSKTSTLELEGAAKVPASEPQSLETKGTPSAILDLGSLVDNAAASFRQTIKLAGGKGQKEIKALAIELVSGPHLSASAGAFFQRAQERVVCLLLFFGKRPVLDDTGCINWAHEEGMGMDLPWHQHLDKFRALQGSLADGECIWSAMKTKTPVLQAQGALAKPVGGDEDRQDHNTIADAEDDGEYGEEPELPTNVVDLRNFVLSVSITNENSEAASGSGLSLEEVAQFNTQVLQCALSSIDLAMESCELKSLAEVNLFENSIRQAQSEAGIEAAKMLWTSKQADLFGQLCTAVQRSRSDLTKQNKLALAAIAAVEAEDKHKMEDKRLEEERRAKLYAETILDKHSYDAFFDTAWSKLGKSQTMGVSSTDHQLKHVGRYVVGQAFHH